MGSLEPLYSYNIEKAKELLAEAGYPDGGLELTIIADGTKDGTRDAIQIIQNQLEQVGITQNLTRMHGICSMISTGWYVQRSLSLIISLTREQAAGRSIGMKRCSQ